MKPFKRILLVYSRDTCDQAVLDLAVSLAKDNEAQVTVIEVIKGLPNDVRGMIAIWSPILLKQPEELLIREERARLVHSVESIRDRGIQGDTKVLIGAPYRAIADETLRNEYDLVILTTDRKDGWKKWLLGGAAASRLFGGGTPERILRCAHCPVLIVQPVHPVTNTIVAATNEYPK